MKLNTKIRYSLRMLTHLAKSKKIVNTIELGKQMLVSPKYLRKLAGALEKHHLIKSEQGVYGGYKLNKKPEKITMAEIFNANNENPNFTNCMDKKKCPLVDECLTRPLWEHLEKVVKKEFFKISIRDILNNKFD